MALLGCLLGKNETLENVLALRELAAKRPFQCSLAVDRSIRELSIVHATHG